MSVTYRYSSRDFSEERFARSGRIVAVVLNYNKKGLIEKAVRSAFEQQYDCYEIVALDDKSDDGSEQEMLDAIKDCICAQPEKAVRVVVAVNEKNRTTLGQWKQAIELSGGEWFGMFCGDDQALPNRISVCRMLMVSSSDVVGVCTNFYLGDSLERGWWERGRYVRTSDMVGFPGPPHTMLGCTCFWNRSLLALDIPKGNIDDLALTFIALISGAGSLIWDLDAVTVRYSVGTGVSTEDCRGVSETEIRLTTLWKRYFAYKRLGLKYGLSFWEEIKRFDAKYGTRGEISRYVRGCWVLGMSRGGGWWSRFMAVFTMLFIDFDNDYGGMRKDFLKECVIRFVDRILGPFSYVACHYLVGKFRQVRRVFCFAGCCAYMSLQ